MNVVGIIPARYHSQRFLGKPLVDILGKPMIQYVYENAKKAEILDEVIVATDDERIMKVVKSFSGKVVKTSPDHKSGTDRIAEVARDLDCEVVVNIQGDQPLISPKAIEDVVSPFFKNESLEIVTLKYPIKDKEEIIDPNIVKVVTDKDDYALYFSRSPIPYYNNTEKGSLELFFKHIGIYAYRRDFLLRFINLAQSSLEIKERLEQLRILENGYQILVVLTDYDSISVDTKKDLIKVKERLEGK
jgi:3-deoxy-manno-octulosonate cytidylyltransferase (CMP-KDO synthetase)